MGRLDQENAGLKDFMGIGRGTANYAEARKHVYGSCLHMRGERKQACMDQQPMCNVDPHVCSQHYEDAIAVVKSNTLGALQRPMTSRWLYNNNDNNLANGTLAFAAMGQRPDWNKPGGRQQAFEYNSAHEQREVENVNDAHQVMRTSSGRGISVNCNFPVKGRLDPSESGMKMFPFVAPVSHEEASTVRVHQIPIANNQALTPPFLAGGGPSMSMQPADSSIKAISTQLTIFYAGQVNVYNDVSSVKAQEIMLTAASGSFLPLNMDMSSKTSIQMVAPPPLSGSLKNPDLPELSWIDPSTCQPDQFARDQVCIDPLPSSISQAPQAEERCMPGAQSTYLDDEPTCPRALPQARKASLVRFLERRKDRVLSKSPYLVEKTFF